METEKINNLILSASFEKSSNIADISYDRFMKILTINFKTGGKYDYLEVEEKIFYEMKKSESVGKYFHTNVRNKYEFFKHSTKKKTEAK